VGTSTIRSCSEAPRTCGLPSGYAPISSGIHSTRISSSRSTPAVPQKAVKEEAAAERLRALISGKGAASTEVKTGAGGETETDGQDALDIEQFGRDQIMGFIGRKFRGHDFARLVDDLLKAQGYRTQFSPPGPDGGVDIIAGAGPMGFDPPRLCVQVKSGDSPAEVSVLRELQGVLSNFSAEQGLLVSWGGFRSSVRSEARQLFFQIRLWDAGDLVGALLQHYDSLPEELQAELPLKRIWALVPEEDEG
jgi:restriction system protein